MSKKISAMIKLMELAIEVDNLVVVRTKATVLNKLSVKLPQGKIIGLLGPSGAGKTTFIRSLVGVQKISSGTVRLLGKPAGSRHLRRQIGYMPQETAAYPDLTVRENLRYFAAVNNAGKPAQAAARVIKQVELTIHQNKLVRNLSGGQASRVSLAIALLGQPQILCLDEPTSGLDPKLRQELWQLFHKLSDSGVTLLISSHVMDEAARCDELLLIRDGQLLAQGSPRQICQQGASRSVEEAFLKLIEAKNV